ncbi:hypothetical protein O6H91_06G106600 [Diphasiastrum complanatum]|uniref:Uncharacterized protein n=1 Tax=Diphasiastrum complanatum TaxID=34168 RepID=A0ACC2DHK9_DIPCM|nr:hypothetical protein O6H91_06G106600 [Diphasiastrum complanatum]
MSYLHQSWDNGPGPAVGYKVAVHRPHYAAAGSNCRRQAQHQTATSSLSSFNIAMQSPSDVIQSRDALAFISPTNPVPTDKALLVQLKAHSHEACTHTQRYENSERRQTIVFGQIQSHLDGHALVAKEEHRVQMKPSLHVHFQFAPEEYKENERTAERTVANESPSSSSSSSIGQGSDSSSCSSQRAATEENEVQSSLRSPLDHMSTLENSLPIKRGLSNFFRGKSRSFTSLADVSSVNDLAKPENPYAKKRKWFHGNGSDSRNKIGYPPICHSFSGSSRKSFPSKDRDTLTLFSTGSDSDDTTSEVSLAFAGLNGKQKRCGPLRSFSLSDLQESGQ